MRATPRTGTIRLPQGDTRLRGTESGGIILPILPRLDRTLEWLYTLFCGWFVYGLFLDGWAHVHIPTLETFFSPWHGIFYSGYFLAAGTLLTWTARRKRAIGAPGFRDAIQDGYGWSVIGVAIFLLGGMGDMLWHEIFGIENDIEALISPTHLLLAAGMLLLVSGGVRSWLLTIGRGGTPTRIRTVIMQLSLAASVSVMLFMTQFGHYTDPEATGMKPEGDLWFYGQGLPILGTLLFSIIIMGAISVIHRTGRMPAGTVLVAMTLPVLGLTYARGGMTAVPAAVIAGLAGEALQRLPLHPAKRWLLSGFAVPFVFTAVLFLSLQILEGIWWAVHVWTGVPVMAGFFGLLTAHITVLRKS